MHGVLPLKLLTEVFVPTSSRHQRLKLLVSEMVFHQLPPAVLIFGLLIQMSSFVMPQLVVRVL
jgi:hypothetical protein